MSRPIWIIRDRAAAYADDDKKPMPAWQMTCDQCKATTPHLYRCYQHPGQLLCCTCHDIASNPERLPLTTWKPKSWRAPA